MKALYFENDIVKVAALKAASKINKFAALGRFSPLAYAEIPEPEIPNDNWLKVENLACGLCGTDIHFIFMDIDPACFPAAIPGVSRKFLGHELVAKVIKTGANATDIKPGDKVAMRIDWPSCFQLEIDPPCPQCARGNYMLCQNQGTRPLPEKNTGGGFSPRMIMHKTQAYKLPDDMTTDAALLLEPLACACHGVLKSEPKNGDKVLVIGAGTIGLLTAAAIKAMFPQTDLYCLARYKFQAEIARKYGAKILNDDNEIYKESAKITGATYVEGYFGNKIILGGFDVVYDSVGADSSVNLALRLVRGKGNVVLVGINFNPGKIDYTPIWNQEINFTGINCHSEEKNGRSSFDAALDLLNKGAIDPADFITHRFKMDDYKEAVKTFFDKSGSKAVKIVLEHK